MAATTPALSPRYRGPELIAHGGMADVYVATDEILERPVAIKVLGDRFAADPEIRARFTREARIAAHLSNEPNVVTIFDVADLDGTPAIVMEFVPGGTVADRIRAARIPPALALAWLEQAGRALDAAHAAGIIHRDVKPANLMIGADSEIRVTDFGIARIAGDVSLTSVGTILGTSGYMSPEQAVGGTATAASDRYGLAVVAFELLSGRRPYLAETFAAEAAAHATAPIPAASSFDGSLPKSVDTVLARGLAKDPGERFGSCAGMVSALRAALFEGAATTIRMPAPAPAVATASVARQRTVRRVAVPALLGAAGLLGILFAVILSRGDSSPMLVVRTATVAGEPVIRTVTVETRVTEPVTQPPPSSAQPAASAPQSGAALNDQGFRLLRAGNAAAALPILERAVAALQGTGSLSEAYASYNLALARFSTGDCNGVKELLHSSEQIQGKRAEIKELRRDVDKGCKH